MTRKCEPAPVSTVAPTFIRHVRWVYKGCVDELRDEGHAQDDMDSSYHYGLLPAYMSAVAAVESFVNEVYLSPFSREDCFHGSPIGYLEDSVEREPLICKIQLISGLLSSSPLESGKQPLQDLGLLMKVRDEIVHYKMKDSLRCVETLTQKGIALPPERSGDELTRLDRMCCPRAVRWAHNTACCVVATLIKITPSQYRNLEMIVDEPYFFLMDKAMVAQIHAGEAIQSPFF